MSTLRGHEWAYGVYVHSPDCAQGMSARQDLCGGTCPLAVGCTGHVRARVPGPGGVSILRGHEWAYRDYVRSSVRAKGMSARQDLCGGTCPLAEGCSGHVRAGAWGLGACPFFAATSGLIGMMSIPRPGHRACPPAGAWDPGACPFFAATSGHMGSMSIPRSAHRACPRARISAAGHVHSLRPRVGIWGLCPFPGPGEGHVHPQIAAVEGAEDPGHILQKTMSSFESCKFCVSTHKI